MSTVAELRQRIPLGLAPELDAAKTPFSVVVFEGPHEAVPIYPALLGNGNMAIPDPVQVVCVIEPDGTENYYSDVDLAGLKPGRLVGRPLVGMSHYLGRETEPLPLGRYACAWLARFFAAPAEPRLRSATWDRRFASDHDNGGANPVASHSPRRGK
ncbi:MAG: hypothetical protein ACR2K4_10565 [Candidatus Limnocylindria bacterium]